MEGGGGLAPRVLSCGRDQVGVSTQVQSYEGSRERGRRRDSRPREPGAATYRNGGDRARNPEFSLGVSNLRCLLGPDEVEQILVYRRICGRQYIYRVFKALKLNEVTQRMDR